MFQRVKESFIPDDFTVTFKGGNDLTDNEQERGMRFGEPITDQKYERWERFVLPAPPPPI